MRMCQQDANSDVFGGWGRLFPILVFYQGWSEEFRIQFNRVRFLAATQNVKEEQLMEQVNIIKGFHGVSRGLRDGMAHELSKAEAKDWDLAILDAGHLVATQADKALERKVQRYPSRDFLK